MLTTDYSKKTSNSNEAYYHTDTSSARNHEFTDNSSTAKEEELDYLNNKFTARYSDFYRSKTIKMPSQYLYNEIQSAIVNRYNMAHMGGVSLDIQKDLSKVSDLFIAGTIDEILKFSFDDLEHDITCTNIGKMLKWMIQQLQGVVTIITMHDRDNKLAIRDLAINYIESARRAAIHMMDHAMPYQSEYWMELPENICNDIIYILNVAYDDIDLVDADEVNLSKDVEIVTCNNLTFYKSVMNKIRQYYTD